jgi:hypothetical protein
MPNLCFEYKIHLPKILEFEAHFPYSQNMWEYCFYRTGATKILFLVGLGPINKKQ